MNMFIGMVIFGVLGFWRSHRNGGTLSDHLQYIAVFALIGLLISFFIGVILLNIG